MDSGLQTITQNTEDSAMAADELAGLATTSEHGVQQLVSSVAK